MLGDRKEQILDIQPNWDMILMLGKGSRSLTSQMQRIVHHAMELSALIAPPEDDRSRFARDVERMVENSRKIEQQGKGAIASVSG